MQTVDVIQSLLLTAGAQWVMWLLFALSLLSLSVTLERWLFFRSEGGESLVLAHKLDPYLAAGEIDEALAMLRALRTVGSRVAEAGLRLAPRGSKAAAWGMRSAVASERALLDQRLPILGTLGNNAPFLGLLGTVIGIVGAFEALGGAGADLGTSTAVMSAIAEALVATAVGIAVALPAVAAYNYFQARITAILDETEAVSNLILAYLAEDDAAEVE